MRKETECISGGNEEKMENWDGEGGKNESGRNKQKKETKNKEENETGKLVRKGIGKEEGEGVTGKVRWGRRDGGEEKFHTGRGKARKG